MRYPSPTPSPLFHIFFVAFVAPVVPKPVTNRPVKLQDYVCHTLTDRPAYYSSKNTAKWTRLWIKAALLLDLIPIADNIEKCSLSWLIETNKCRSLNQCEVHANFFFDSFQTRKAYSLSFLRAGNHCPISITFTSFLPTPLNCRFISSKKIFFKSAIKGD